MWALVHSLLHDQAAWHGSRTGDCAVGGERSRRKNCRRKHEGKRNHVSDRIIVRTPAVANWTKLILAMERRASPPGHDAACVGGEGRGPALSVPEGGPSLHHYGTGEKRGARS